MERWRCDSGGVGRGFMMCGGLGAPAAMTPQQRVVFHGIVKFRRAADVYDLWQGCQHAGEGVRAADGLIGIFGANHLKCQFLR